MPLAPPKDGVGQASVRFPIWEARRHRARERAWVNSQGEGLSLLPPPSLPPRLPRVGNVILGALVRGGPDTSGPE